MRATLHHIELCSEAPRRLVSFYRTALGVDELAVADERTLCHGPERRILIAPGPARTLNFAAYAASAADVEALKARCRGAGVELLSSPSLLFAADAIALRDPEGRVLVFGQEEWQLRPEPAGLRGRLQHLGVATPDPDGLVRFYADILGFAVSDEVRTEGGALTASFLRSDPEHHSLAIFRAKNARLDHHCYEAGEWSLIRDWADHFARNGTCLSWGPGRHGPGNNLFLMVEDPDGNAIEVSAELELVPEGKPAGQWPHSASTLNRWGQAILRS